MTLVVDSSALAASLAYSDEDARWAQTILANDDLAGPHLLPAEVANILRRAALHGDLSRVSAGLAHQELLELPLNLFPYEPLARRIWELRDNVTTYDAWYVALAEQLGAPLVTLDRKLATANGPLCEFLTPRRSDSFETGME